MAITRKIFGHPDIRSTIYYKAFMVSELDGWYVEFGTFRGYSFNIAFQTVSQIIDDFCEGMWAPQPIGSPAQVTQAERYRRIWRDMRFVAFDSFEGVPAHRSQVDKVYPDSFPAGSYACDEPTFRHLMQAEGVDMSKVVTVPGFYDRTLTETTAERIGLKRISVLHIDSDLYESARLALNFATPYLRDGTTIIFDEWYQFRGNPFLGERRAFTEWQAAHPEWYVTELGMQGPWSKAFLVNLKPRIPRQSLRAGLDRLQRNLKKHVKRLIGRA